jgi:hypothetical protein
MALSLISSPNSTRCSLVDCRKKLRPSEGISGLCKCKLLFCSIHKPTTIHNCAFDYKKEHEDKLNKANPRIIGEKIKKI